MAGKRKDHEQRIAELERAIKRNPPKWAVHGTVYNDTCGCALCEAYCNFVDSGG